MDESPASEDFQARWDAEIKAREEKEKEYAAVSPTLFRALTDKDKTTPIGWNGIETPSGWKKPVLEMVKELDAVFQPYGKSPPVIEQLKNKFAGLRCYMNWGEDATEDQISKGQAIIRKYEKMCSKTSESSGEPGKLYICNGWYITLSPKEIENDVERGFKKFEEEVKAGEKYHGLLIVHYRTKEHGTDVLQIIHEQNKPEDNEKYLAGWDDPKTREDEGIELVKILKAKDIKKDGSGAPRGDDAQQQ